MTWAQFMEEWTYVMLTMQEAAQSWAHLARRMYTVEATERASSGTDDLAEREAGGDRAAG